MTNIFQRGCLFHLNACGNVICWDSDLVGVDTVGKILLPLKSMLNVWISSFAVKNRVNALAFSLYFCFFK